MPQSGPLVAGVLETGSVNADLRDVSLDSVAGPP